MLGFSKIEMIQMIERVVINLEDDKRIQASKTHLRALIIKNKKRFRRGFRRGRKFKTLKCMKL